VKRPKTDIKVGTRKKRNGRLGGERGDMPRLPKKRQSNLWNVAYVLKIEREILGLKGGFTHQGHRGGEHVGIEREA